MNDKSPLSNIKPIIPKDHPFKPDAFSLSFLRLLRMNWSKILRKDLIIKEIKKETGFVSQFMEDLPSPCLLLPFIKDDGTQLSLYINLSNQLGTGLIDLSLGGNHKYGDTDERTEWHSFDIKVLDGHKEGFSQSLTSALKPFSQKIQNVRPTSFINESKLFKKFNPKEIAFLFRWQVQIEGFSGNFDLCIGSGEF